MPHGNAQPDEPNHARNHSICDLATSRVVGELQAQSALDDGEGEEKAAPPDVQGRPDRSPLCFDVDGVVESTEDGLEDESGQDGNTDDGMIFVDLYMIELVLTLFHTSRMTYGWCITWFGRPTTVGAWHT